MTTKTVYLYNKNTRAYEGLYDAFESPAEPGAFLEPEYSTNKEVPDIPANKWAYLNSNGEWELRDNLIPAGSEKMTMTIESYYLAVRKFMSYTAQTSPEHFNSISEAKSFAATENPYTEVSKAFITWSAKVLHDASTKLDAVFAGDATLPDLEEFIASLPEWVHP